MDVASTIPKGLHLRDDATRSKTPPSGPDSRRDLRDPRGKGVQTQETATSPGTTNTRHVSRHSRGVTVEDSASRSRLVRMPPPGSPDRRFVVLRRRDTKISRDAHVNLPTEHGHPGVPARP